jgi:hypothetical protein
VTRAFVFGLVVAGACHAAKPEPRLGTAECTPSSGDTLPASATAAPLAGEFRLHLVATAGSRKDARQDARLSLRPMDDSLRTPPLILGIRDTTTRHPLLGVTEVDPAALGGVPTGDLTSTRPTAPGVLVIERHPVRPGAPAEITLRLGADANRRGVVRYDGGFFALTVRRIDSTGFAGSWASGATGRTAEGYFCAERS